MRGASLVLCPGSFDPPTNGHVDVVERAARHFESVLVAVIENPSKKTLFTPEERMDMLRASLGHVGNVEVASFDGLLVDFARARGIALVIKGLRAVSDFDYELQMAEMNASLAPGIDTIFMAASPDRGFLSSSLVKEVVGYGGDVSGLVPGPVDAALRERLSTAP
jgi:pantetheine-phosphate adenylyltransferase